jgi:hypothetical protein
MDEFEDTQGLSSEQLYELLEQGDAQERVFAIWALGLRSAGAVTMADQLRVEPDAGVRRALAVVLAGQGETTLPAEQRALRLELAATCETAQASDDDGDLATNDDDDAVDVEWRQSLHAELRALVARFACPERR